jgi:O-antigen/teichoic acid export membrane protein
MRPDGLATSVAILLAVSVVQRAVGFGRGVLFCRWLSPEELGHWEMAYSFLLLAAPIAVLGVPGSMGRYLERYRNQNQLHTFLRRTMAWTALLAAGAVTLILLNVGTVSSLIFAQPDRRTMVALLAVSLAAVVLHHFLEALFAALRKFRIVSTMQFTQSICFATISLLLLVWLPVAAESIVLAYGLACALSSLGMLLWMRRPVEELMIGDKVAITHHQFWPPLLRFAIWVWVTNLLCHMFAVVDRYMIVHCSGMDHTTALAQVGNYHSSRILPLLFVSLADLLAGVVMPYLSHDWEAGRRSDVVRRMNLVLKLTALAMLTAGVVVLWLAPWLFHVAFAGKYDEGLAVLPWTLAYSVGYALLIVAQCYIWCAERTRIGTLPLIVGLAVNVVLNLVLLPYWGLWGAVVATTIATGVALVVLFGLNAAAGMRFDWGMIVVCGATFCLSGGPLLATCVLGALLAAAFGPRGWLSASERQVIAGFVGSKRGSLAHLVGAGAHQETAATTLGPHV